MTIWDCRTHVRMTSMTSSVERTDLDFKISVALDQVIFNDGNDYNPLTELFIVSEPGVYLLTFTIVTDQLPHWVG